MEKDMNNSGPLPDPLTENDERGGKRKVPRRSSLNRLHDTSTAGGRDQQSVDSDEVRKHKLANKDIKWLVEVCTNDGKIHIYDKVSYTKNIRQHILDGSMTSTSKVTEHYVTTIETWNSIQMELSVFAHQNFMLRMLYEPVSAHAVIGFAVGGLSLTPVLGIMYLIKADRYLKKMGDGYAIGINPWIALGIMAGSIVLAIILGGPIGRSIGGLIGIYRRKNVKMSPEITENEKNVLMGYVIFPLIASVMAWVMYIYILNPWIESIIVEHNY